MRNFNPRREIETKQSYTLFEAVSLSFLFSFSG